MAIIWPKQPAMYHAPASARAPRVCTLVPFICSVIEMPSGNCLVSARGSLVGTCTCLGCAVLLCFVVCLTLLTSFFLPSHLSLTLGAHAGYSSRSVCLFVCPRLFLHYMLLGGL